jgi:hypothetical protein
MKHIHIRRAQSRYKPGDMVGLISKFTHTNLSVRRHILYVFL